MTLRPKRSGGGSHLGTDFNRVCRMVARTFSEARTVRPGTLAGLVCLLLALPMARACAEQVRVDPAKVEVARWEGWGCSLSWWAVYSRNWSEEQRREICRLLFSRDADALGFNVCRFNAGGTAETADKGPFRPGGAVRVLLDQDGAWHPERDRAQIDCLQLAKKYGANVFELFANSPPYWMLKNGNTRGGDAGTANLKPSLERAYADWLVSTAEKLQESANVQFDYIAPFNEPSANWWKGKSGNQEGCAFSPPQQAIVLRELQARLVRDKSPYLVAASDENGAREGYATLGALTDSLPPKHAGGKGARLFDKLNVHAYSGWEWQERLRDLAIERGVPKIWMSEVTYREWENAGFIPEDMRCALPITRSIVGDIKRLHCSAWVFWQPVESLQYCLQYHYTYGLLPTSVDSDQPWNGKTYRPGQFVIAKSFYALRQLTAFIRPNDRLVASGDEWTLAAVSQDGKRLVLVVHNDSQADKPYTFDLSAFKQTGTHAQVWRTRDSRNGVAFNCKELPSVPIRDRRFADVVPARSVTTYVLDNIAR